MQSFLVSRLIAFGLARCRLVVTATAAIVIPLLLVSTQASAQSRSFELSAPAELVESGLIKYMVPRFSLKTATRVQLVEEGASASARFNTTGEGRVMFSGPQGNWFLELTEGDGDEAAKRFSDWLAGKVGQKTVASFVVDGRKPYGPASVEDRGEEVVTYEGDALEGEKLAVRHCGRCHAVNAKTQWSTIGSTPSFALMRSFKDWERRFLTFYVLKPHPAFTQVAKITQPFHESRPSPIVPVETTMDEIQQILAYVAKIKPADLGAPLKQNRL